MAAKPKKMDIEDYAPLSAGMEAHWEVRILKFITARTYHKQKIVIVNIFRREIFKEM